MGDISVQFGTKLWEQAATSSQDKTWNGDGVKEDVRPSTMGLVAVILSYSLHKTYHQRIALYIVLLICVSAHCHLSTLGNKNKNSKGTSTVKLVDH